METELRILANKLNDDMKYVVGSVECWKTMKVNNTYEVSSFGNVRHKGTKRVRFPGKRGDYLSHVLGDNSYSVHRLVADAFLINYDEKPYVDHIDGNKHNNHISNLRWCNASENGANRKKMKNATSEYKGVRLKKQTGRWCAQIMINNKSSHIGYYETERDGALAYNKKALEIFGEFAKLNVIV